MQRRREPSDIHRRGREAEIAARAMLEARGLRTLACNFRTRWGELDLVMEQDSTIVFVEVRLRLNNSHGGAAASVTAAKQARLVRAAAQFLADRQLAHCPARFDIVAFDGRAPQQMHWLQDAFRVID